MHLATPLAVRVLHDTGIRDAIADGSITVSPSITDDQVQTATLDVRIGAARVYDKESWALAALHATPYQEPTSEFAHRTPDEKDAPIHIPPGAFAELFLRERIEAPSYWITHELRSSMGRRGLFPTNMILEQEDGAQYISVWNHFPRPVTLYSGEKFAQLFFHPPHEYPADGHVVTDVDRIAELLPDLAARGSITPEGYVRFDLGTFVKRAIPSPEPLDTKRKYPDEELFENVPLERRVFGPEESIPRLRAGEFCIAQLTPRLHLPATIGIRLLAGVPINARSPVPRGYTDLQRVNAGWVDPGYEGNITAHPFRWHDGLRLEERMPFAYGLVYEYETACGRPYGSSALGSHYQGSSGTSARV